ncbi:hypothetical protein TI39_contig399g00002 [Zymoseptoria brevis]|uniref:SMP domain-containing protein n=1 Tax=Zymoseptoria brevis TaxID=1047168 RepID=A0A0F4GR05_9PEZI|nr:hypothetical protein TI39_contig399g00002 [Zymoseptoria brevis]
MSSRFQLRIHQALLRSSTFRPTHIRSTPQQLTPHLRGLATSSTNMASAQSTTGGVISETARAEGGPSKGSTAAEMQSQASRTQNFEQAVQEVGAKMQNDPASVSSEDAAYLKSREARVIGQGQPPADSISAEAQRLASATKEARKSSRQPSDPTEQSANDRVSNFEAVADDVARKMASNPASVTKDEADLLHSREQRAFGNTSKGGIASQAQSIAAENEKKGAI